MNLFRIATRVAALPPRRKTPGPPVGDAESEIRKAYAEIVDGGPSVNVVDGVGPGETMFHVGPVLVKCVYFDDGELEVSCMFEQDGESVFSAPVPWGEDEFAKAAEEVSDFAKLTYLG